MAQMNDEMIWQVINHQFCSYKTTIGRQTKSNTTDRVEFCRHPYSVTGKCNRTSCPLANAKYATIRENEGKIWLCMKTVERAHSPKNLWERVLLSRNYATALAQLDEQLQYYPKTLVHRNKQRLTKIHQYLIRMRKIELKARRGDKARTKTSRIHRKIEQRELRRERKALLAAKLERSVESELEARLAKGTYGEIYNFGGTMMAKSKAAVAGAEQEEETEETSESMMMAEEEEEEKEDEGARVEYVENLEEESDSEEEEEEEEDYEEEDFDEGDDYLGDGQWGTFDGSASSDEDEEDSDSDSDDSSSDEDESDDDDGDKKQKPKKKKRRQRSQPPSAAAKKQQQQQQQHTPRIEIEYEEEEEQQGARATATATATNRTSASAASSSRGLGDATSW